MKTILLLLLLCAVFDLPAQNIVYDNEAKTYGSYNATTGTVTPIKDKPIVYNGSDVSYWLVNVNSFAQKVDINGQLISLTTDMPDQLKTLFNIKKEAEKALDNTQKQVDKMDDVKRGASSGSDLQNQMVTLVDKCNEYYQEAQNIKEALALYERLSETMIDKSFANVNSMAQALVKRHVDATSIAGLRTDFDKFEAAYKLVYQQYRLAIDEARAAKDKDKEARIVSAQEQVEKDYNTLEDKYTKTLASIDNLFDKATDPVNYVIKSDAIKLHGTGGDADEVKFTVKVDEKSRDDLFPVHGGWKIDFSTGPAINFISDNQYFKGTGDTLRRISKGGLFNTITPSVAAMMHVYERTHKNTAYGGMFGINAGVKELSDINLGFMAGVSAILGRSQKVILSTGVSYLKVTRLKEGQYMEGKPYKDVKVEDMTESVLRPSWFIAISFNLSKRNTVD